MKCDETKPSCQQCVRRRITCGGYKKNIRWKAFGKSRDASEQPDQIRPLDKGAAAENQLQNAMPLSSSCLSEMFSDENGNCFASFPIEGLCTGSEFQRRPEPSTVNALLTPPSFDLFPTTEAEREAGESAVASFSAGCMFDLDGFGIFDVLRSDFTAPVNLSRNQTPKIVDFDLSSPDTDINAAFCSQNTSQHFDLLAQSNDINLTNNEGLDLQAFDGSVANEPGSLPLDGAVQDEASVETSRQTPSHVSSIEREHWSFEPSSPHSSLLDDLELYSLWRQPRLQSGSPEMITQFFERQTCRILSVKDDPTENPWRTLIWPLAKDCPALYHAISAMTCFHMGKIQPQLRIQGIGHVQCSMEAMATDNGKIRLDAALATTLALGFAANWDHQKPSTGIEHIKTAKAIIKRAIFAHRASRLSTGELTRLSFLSNTWMYMDVIARLTSVDDGGFTDFEFMTACSLLGSTPQELQIDPLMGCAATLFPILGQVADLVRRVRKRSSTAGNSPTIISQAAELKRAIECWIPPVGWASEDPTVNNPDLVQTAEAYRWATLLLLRQAVPELPSSISPCELAQKTMVFLATVPLTSRTIVVQTFPLMVAGCEVMEEEDRAWVRERWKRMSRRMITGIVDRCVEVTEEVWRRKDEYEASNGLCPTPRTGSLQNSGGDSFAMDADLSRLCDPLSPLQDCFGLPNFPGGDANSGRRRNSKAQVTANLSQPFTFGEGVDIMARPSRIKYTVKGKYHWIGVMRDQNLEVMLG
ncbi:uncharacterized protein K452DRAFT_311582 [Aplosporella prunicola CBS 121167]|uniref:Zn(2)-C6 fungal-type domain-containing protein n=1 Tax=Aplosporella prunicola CBS 121167 TaxID=1176127 RepID=A0A6A6B492_9PEZI|nr:uncharacterized protein K452DRAFT_311582 [Aplosporella prunicola CBS 121167]KAF2138213.1 hypothetical protein K452DRAFT_311582 [Aplosporella prunicola CBS 121167]